MSVSIDISKHEHMNSLLLFLCWLRNGNSMKIKLEDFTWNYQLTLIFFPKSPSMKPISRYRLDTTSKI